MSKIHVLSADLDKNYTIAIHFPVISGSNSANKTWKSVGLASGITGTTILEVGANPGNITQEEMDSITSGDTIEIVETIRAESGGTTNESIEAMADDLIAAWKANMGERLKYYGYTI